jgi:hypothetical protein
MKGITDRSRQEETSGFKRPALRVSRGFPFGFDYVPRGLRRVQNLMDLVHVVFGLEIVECLARGIGVRRAFTPETNDATAKGTH